MLFMFLFVVSLAFTSAYALNNQEWAEAISRFEERFDEACNHTDLSLTFDLNSVNVHLFPPGQHRRIGLPAQMKAAAQIKIDRAVCMDLTMTSLRCSCDDTALIEYSITKVSSTGQIVEGRGMMLLQIEDGFPKILSTTWTDF